MIANAWLQLPAKHGWCPLLQHHQFCIWSGVQLHLCRAFIAAICIGVAADAWQDVCRVSEVPD